MGCGNGRTKVIIFKEVICDVEINVDIATLGEWLFVSEETKMMKVESQNDEKK